MVGCLFAGLAARIPGTRVELVDINPARAQIADRLGVGFTVPENAAAAADTAPWEACVRIVQRAFRDGIVPDRLLWSTVVLLPKGDGGHRGIGLLEPLWKAISTQTHESN